MKKPSKATMRHMPWPDRHPASARQRDRQVRWGRVGSSLNPLALLLGARSLLGAPGLTTRNKKLVGALLGARTLLGAPGRTFSNKKLLQPPGIATRSKDATRGSWPYY